MAHTNIKEGGAPNMRVATTQQGGERKKKRGEQGGRHHPPHTEGGGERGNIDRGGRTISSPHKKEADSVFIQGSKTARV